MVSVVSFFYLQVTLALHHFFLCYAGVSYVFFSSFSSFTTWCLYLSCLFYWHGPAKVMDLDKEDICNTSTYRKIYLV